MNIELAKIGSDSNKTNDPSTTAGYVPPTLEKSNTKSGPTPGITTAPAGNIGSNIISRSGNLPSFTCKCDYYQKAMTGDRYEFVFSITEKYTRETWKIIKTYSDFNNFQKALEKRLNRSIPFLEQYVSKSENNKQTMQEEFLNKRKDGLENYLKAILGNTTYYDPILYHFIGYDILTRKPASTINTPRASFRMIIIFFVIMINTFNIQKVPFHIMQI